MSLGERGRYVLRFGASKLEADLEGTLLTRGGGTLGGAAARAETYFALTHPERATARLLTERHERVDVPLSDALVASSSALFAQATNGAKLNVADDAHVLLLSDRTQLLVTNSRKGASINGTIVGTMAGTAAVPLKGLFSTVDSAKLVDDERIGHVLGETSPPFAQIPMKYPNWDAIQATIGINAPVDSPPQPPASVTDSFGPARQLVRVVWFCVHVSENREPFTPRHTAQAQDANADARPTNAHATHAQRTRAIRFHTAPGAASGCVWWGV